jgi:hypothetical protein
MLHFLLSYYGEDVSLRIHRRTGKSVPVPTKNLIRLVNRWKFVVLTVNLAGHESCPIVGSFYVALVLPNSNKYAD